MVTHLSKATGHSRHWLCGWSMRVCRKSAIHGWRILGIVRVACDRHCRITRSRRWRIWRRIGSSRRMDWICTAAVCGWWISRNTDRLRRIPSCVCCKAADLRWIPTVRRLAWGITSIRRKSLIVCRIARMAWRTNMWLWRIAWPSSTLMWRVTTDVLGRICMGCILTRIKGCTKGLLRLPCGRILRRRSGTLQTQHMFSAQVFLLIRYSSYVSINVFFMLMVKNNYSRILRKIYICFN